MPRMTPSQLIGVVEPDADVREFIQALLTREGYRCESFVSAERFERAAATRAYACVITDSDLPGMDGLELARRVHASAHPVPVMLLTSDAGSDIQQAAHAASISSVQRKPLGVREFLSSVAQVTAG